MVKKVIVYSTAACPWCWKTKEFLKEHGIPFEDVDVGVDRDRAMEMVQKSGQMGVPVIAITTDDGKEHIIVGFNEEKLREVLGL